MNGNLNEKRRLLESLEFIDDEILSDTLSRVRPEALNGKNPNSAKKPMTAVKQIALIAACAILLGAVIPVANFVLQRIGVVVGENAGSGTTDILESESNELSCNEDLLDEDTEVSENIEPNANGVRIYDRYHPDDSERYPYFSVTFPALDNSTVECRDEKFNPVYLNGEKLPLIGYGVPSFYLSDLTGDGYPELCFGTSFGSGIMDQRIEIVDYTTKTVIFSLSDRMYHDYYLFFRNGVLCVKEKKYMQSNVTRTGVLIYNGSEIKVVWDSEVNDTFDRDIQSDTIR